MKLQDKVIIKATGKEGRICGFADESKLPDSESDPVRYEWCKHFKRGSGIPPEFDAHHAKLAPSLEAIFVEYHIEDEEHPLRAAQRERGAAHRAQAEKDGTWESNKHAHSGRQFAAAKGLTIKPAEFKVEVLNRIESGHVHGGWVHQWFEPSELVKAGE